MTFNQILGGLTIYQLASARLRYRGAWWFFLVFLVVLFVAAYYAISRLCVVWPYRLFRTLVNP